MCGAVCNDVGKLLEIRGKFFLSPAVCQHKLLLSCSHISGRSDGERPGDPDPTPIRPVGILLPVWNKKSCINRIILKKRPLHFVSFLSPDILHKVFFVPSLQSSARLYSQKQFWLTVVKHASFLPSGPHPYQKFLVLSCTQQLEMANLSSSCEDGFRFLRKSIN